MQESGTSLHIITPASWKETPNCTMTSRSEMGQNGSGDQSEGRAKVQARDKGGSDQGGGGGDREVGGPKRYSGSEGGRDQRPHPGFGPEPSEEGGMGEGAKH